MVKKIPKSRLLETTADIIETPFGTQIKKRHLLQLSDKISTIGKWVKILDMNHISYDLIII